MADETSNTAWTIRTAVEQDVDQLFGLATELATSFRPERQAFAQSFREALADEAASLSVAERQGELLGYCLGFDHVAFYANGRVAWVEELIVTTTWRGRGIGRRLMEEFERWASSRGARVVSLATRRAASFYVALGYEESAAYFRKVL